MEVGIVTVERADPVRVSQCYRKKKHSGVPTRVGVNFMVVADQLSARVA